MFVQSEEFVENRTGRRDELAVYGQESNPTTWKLCRMNLAIRGIDANLGQQNADSFHNDQHKSLKADYIMANPPFNVSDWGGERLVDDIRWDKYGVPPTGNANYAWILHMLYHLAPSGTAGFVLANGSLSSSTISEYNIRKNLIQDDKIDCIVTLPGSLFSTTSIPVCLWFITRNKLKNGHRDRKGEILFIDARNIKTGDIEGSRTQRKLKQSNIDDITASYHAFLSVMMLNLQNKNISLIFDTEMEEKVIAIDLDKIERVILNLLSNAMKFTSPGGSIMVNMSEQDNYVLISVKDTGIGIPEELQSAIFDRLVQVDRSFTKSSEGSGIGLSISKSIIDMHGGRIYVNSQVGEGSEFIVELPSYTIEGTKAEAAAVDEMDRIEKVKIEFSDIYL